ncbi:MAG: peptidylprolyl isomerase [Acidobacteriota bacterium]
MTSSSPARPRKGWTLWIALVATAVGAGLPALSEEEPKLYVHLEPQMRFSYAGDPTNVSILFKNIGKAPWPNPGMDIPGGFQVYDSDGRKLDKAEVSALQAETQPKGLQPDAFFGQIIDLTTLFPKINTVGTYRIAWSAPGVPEQSVVVRVIKKYDPEKSYQAVIETDFGNIVLEFYRDLAPMHVKNFIDLANQGFYDRRTWFHRIIKSEVAFGGSPTGDERGSPGYTLPPEPNGLKILAGSVAQVRNSLTGLEESGCIFLIATRPQPEMDNRYTVFARVAEGLETVKAITNLPTVGGSARLASRPIKDVLIKKIGIREKRKIAGRS